MRTLNRSAIIVTPKQPLLEWLHSIDPSSHDLKITDLQSDPSVYLFPECNDDNDLTRYLKEFYEEIFEQELESWDRLEETWPRDRSFKTFQGWFDYRIHWMIFDLADQPLELEEI